VTCRCTRTSHNSSVRATESCVNFAVFAGHCLNWSPHSLCPRSTTATWLLQVYRSMNWTGCSLSSTRPLGSRQMPADTTIWHNFWWTFRLRNDLYCVEWGVKLYSLTHFWWTYTGCGFHNVSSTSCVCWCTAAMNGTAPGYLSDLTVSVGSTARRQLRPSSTSDLVVRYHQHVGINRGPRVRLSRSTSVEQSSAGAIPPLNLQILLFLQKMNLNSFFLVSHSGRDNVNNDEAYVKRSRNSLYCIQ